MPPALHRTGAPPRTKKGAAIPAPAANRKTRRPRHGAPLRRPRRPRVLVPARPRPPNAHAHTPHARGAAREESAGAASAPAPSGAPAARPGPPAQRARAVARFFFPAIRLLTTVKSHLPLRARPPPTAIHVGGAKTLDASARSASERCTVTSN